MEFRSTITTLLLAVATTGGALDGVATHAQDDAAIRGVVRGDRSLTSRDTAAYDRIAGASISVYFELPHAPRESCEVWRHEFVGAITSDTRGEFEVRPVPVGYYTLHVTPPPGSPYAGGIAATVTMPAHTQDRSIVWLYPTQAASSNRSGKQR